MNAKFFDIKFENINMKVRLSLNRLNKAKNWFKKILTWCKITGENL